MSQVFQMLVFTSPDGTFNLRPQTQDSGPMSSISPMSPMSPCLPGLVFEGPRVQRVPCCAPPGSGFRDCQSSTRWFRSRSETAQPHVELSIVNRQWSKRIDNKGELRGCSNGDRETTTNRWKHREQIAPFPCCRYSVHAVDYSLVIKQMNDKKLNVWCVC